MSEEDPVIQTNTDAALSKRDAVNKGYWHDPYIQYFVKSSERKTPEISRGYYARVQGVKMLLDRFLKLCGPECQIVNLGAGFDTLFWRLMDDKAQFKSLVEVDLPAVTTRKCYYIRLRKQLLKGIATEGVSSLMVNSNHRTREPAHSAIEHLNPSESMHSDCAFQTFVLWLEQVGGACELTEEKPAFLALVCASYVFNQLLIHRESGLSTPTIDDDVRVSASDLHAGHYHLVGCDLRELDVFEAKVVHESGLDLKLPTLFIAECVLVYMSCDESSALLSWITRNFSNAVLVSYDPVNMGDKFAEVMVENLKQRNCLLAGLQACTSIKAQEERICHAGWEVCKVWTMNQVYQSFPSMELHRVEKLEMLDERELLDQLLSHYCLCVAYKGGGVPSKFEQLSFPLDPR